MLSYQSIELKGTVEDFRVDPYQGNLAGLQIDGFNGLLTVPLDNPDMCQIGDCMTVKVFIDRVIPVDRLRSRNCEACYV